MKPPRVGTSSHWVQNPKRYTGRDRCIGGRRRWGLTGGSVVGVDHLTLEAVCAAADVPRSSSHSAWAIDDDYTPLSMFQREVLRAWLTERENSMFADAAQDALTRLFSDPENPPTAPEIVRTTIQSAFYEGYNTGDSFRPLGSLLAMRSKAIYGESSFIFFGIAVASLVEGIGLRNTILPELELDRPMFPTPPGDVPTLLIGACVEAIIPIFFEPIPDQQ
jgi:hypothetical protein